MQVRKESTWIADFILHEGENTVCKGIYVNASNIVNAACRAGNLIQEKYPGQKFYVHNLGMADPVEKDGIVFDDPLGWEQEELEAWKWE